MPQDQVPGTEGYAENAAALTRGSGNNCRFRTNPGLLFLHVLPALAQ